MHAHDDEMKLNGNFLLAAAVPTCNSVVYKNYQFHLLAIKAQSVYLVSNNGLISSCGVCFPLMCDSSLE